MTTLRVENQVKDTVLEHWWMYTRSKHRLFLRMSNETPEVFAQIPYLDVIISNIDQARVNTLRDTYPRATADLRTHLLSAERYFVECLRAVRNGNMPQANMFYNVAQNELTMLKYIFMEAGIKVRF